MVSVPGDGGGTLFAERGWASLFEDAAVVRRQLGLDASSGVALYPDGPVEYAAATVLAAAAAASRLVLPEPGAPPDGWDLEEMLAGGDVSAVVAGSRSFGDLIATGWDARAEVLLVTDPFLPSTVEADLRARTQRFVRAWGTTETGIAVLGEGSLDDEGLGRGAGAARLRVVDDRGRPVPVGVEGELLVGGPALARGYRGEPTATARRFVRDPFDAEGRAFRTGQLARWVDGGRLVPGGRADRQWSLDGPRFDLDRVEQVILRHPLVDDVHAAIRPVDGERHLVAYIGMSDPDAALGPMIRSDLAHHLPSWAIPARLLPVPSIPRSASGAVNERKLLALTREEGDGYVAPRTEEERALADVWREALSTDRVGVNDNFFELGGHSLLAVQVSRTLETKLGWRIDPRSLFFHTLEQVARGAARPAGATAGVVGKAP
jgi:acyl-CoA synthetase (AMP-forming)/AMP-acid ligase II